MICKGMSLRRLFTSRLSINLHIKRQPEQAHEGNALYKSFRFAAPELSCMHHIIFRPKIVVLTARFL